MNESGGKTKLWKRIKHATHYDRLSPFTRKVLVAIVGGVVLLAGVAMIFLPGPAFVAIPLGLAIMATEFEWAQRWLQKAKRTFASARQRYRNRRRGSAPQQA